ncbi:hypothetical protein Tco_0674315 [Tanacetum coccineum]
MVRARKHGNSAGMPHDVSEMRGNGEMRGNAKETSPRKGETFLKLWYVIPTGRVVVPTGRSASGDGDGDRGLISLRNLAIIGPTLQNLPFSPATNPGNPGRLVAGDRFPGRHVARDRSNGKARWGYVPGRQCRAT